MLQPRAVRILHWLSSKKFGGTPQVFLDYQLALSAAGCLIEPVVRPHSHLSARLRSHHIPPRVVHYYRHKLAPIRSHALRAVRKVIATYRPTHILVHKLQDLILLRQATSTIPLVAVAHNYSTGYANYADALVAVSRSVAQNLQPHATQPLFTAENFLLSMPPSHPMLHTQPLRMGYLGQLRKTKGILELVATLSLLNKHQLPFRCLIGLEATCNPTLGRKFEPWDGLVKCALWGG